MSNRTRYLRVGAVILVTLIALLLRLRAADMLPIDYDEDDYLYGAQNYAYLIKNGDFQGVIDYYHDVHPALAKLVYGFSLLPLPQEEPFQEPSLSAPIASSLPQPQLKISRYVSVVFGSLEVLVVAILNPLAGLFLAISTWHIKYTSQVMLEALPSLTSALAVVFYLLSKRKKTYMLWISAVMLGLTLASKYTYLVAGIVIMIDWYQTTRTENNNDFRKIIKNWVPSAAAWMGVSILVFFIANPYIWNDTVNRFLGSILFHGEYTRGDQVQQAGYPFWQPLIWLLSSVPWHPGVFVISVDALITIFGLIGFGRTWRKYRIFAVWLLFALIILLIWPTKWPQYVLILLFPLCISAAEGFQAVVWEPSVRAIRHVLHPQPSTETRQSPRELFWDLFRVIPWLLPGLLVLGAIAFYPLIYQAGMALTDFSATAIRDGLNGGVWREVRLGLTGNVDPVGVELFRSSTSKTVHYAGPSLLVQVLTGSGIVILVFSALWTVMSLLAQTTLGVTAAMLVGRPGVRFKSLWRVLFILPWAIPEFVGALMWFQLFDPRFGWLNLAAKTWSQTADYPGALNFTYLWQENPTYAFVVLLITATWYGFPFMMLAATAGLKLMPEEVDDAAAIDGASGWQKLRSITLPLLMPLLIPAILIRGIFAFNQFYIFYVLQPPFPLATLSIVSFFFFDQRGQYAVSAAINVFTVIVLIGFILWFNRWSRASEGVTYA